MIGTGSVRRRSTLGLAAAAAAALLASCSSGASAPPTPAGSATGTSVPAGSTTPGSGTTPATSSPTSPASSPGRPSSSTPPTSAPSSAPPTTGALPPRRGELNAAGIDPCKLLLKPPNKELHIVSATPSDQNAYKGATCIYNTIERVQYAVTATDGLTVERFRTLATGRENSVSDTSGFPTVTSYDPARPTRCVVGVGTSATGMVVVTTLDTRASASDKDNLCQRTRTVAVAALEGLRAQQVARPA